METQIKILKEIEAMRTYTNVYDEDTLNALQVFINNMELITKPEEKPTYDNTSFAGKVPAEEYDRMMDEVHGYHDKAMEIPEVKPYQRANQWRSSDIEGQLELLTTSINLLIRNHNKKG